KSSVPEPTRFSRKPIPTDVRRPAVSGASASIPRWIVTARCSDSVSLYFSAPVRLVCPTMLRHALDDATSRAASRNHAVYGPLTLGAASKDVRAADFRVGQKIERAWAEQEFDRQTVGRKTEGDDLREGFVGLVGAAELAVDQIETVEHTKL